MACDPESHVLGDEGRRPLEERGEDALLALLQGPQQQVGADHKHAHHPPPAEGRARRDEQLLEQLGELLILEADQVHLRGGQ